MNTTVTVVVDGTVSFESNPIVYDDDYVVAVCVMYNRRVLERKKGDGTRFRLVFIVCLPGLNM